MPYKKGHTPDKPFQKGHVPWNKGKYLGTGSCPNWLPVGTKRIDPDGYERIKVYCTGKWSVDWPLRHKVAWEKKNGPVPKGLVFWFKDRDKLNTWPTNLELITKGERMRRNAYYNKTDAEIEEIEQRRGKRKHVQTLLKKQGYKINRITVHRIL